VEYLLLYDQELKGDVPQSVLDILRTIKPPIDLICEEDFESFKIDLFLSEWSEEWKWYRALGKGTRRDLNSILDHELPEWLNIEARRKSGIDWNKAGEFLLEMMKIIREKGLVGSQPVRSNRELHFVKEIL
jgi:hypothetical protein